MEKFAYVITNPEGIHARPAGMLVKAALQFQSSVILEKGDRTGDAKRIFSVIGLGVKMGDEVIVTIEGADEDAAASAIKEFFQENL